MFPDIEQKFCKILTKSEKLNIIDNYIDELNTVTGLKYSYYNIKKEKAYWLKRMSGANSLESIDYKYKSLDDLYDNLKKTLDDATLLKELV